MVIYKAYDNNVTKHIEKHKLNYHAHHNCPDITLSLSISQYHQAVQQSLQMQQQHMLQQQMMMQQPIYQSQQQQHAHYTALVRHLIHLER